MTPGDASQGARWWLFGPAVLWAVVAAVGLLRAGVTDSAWQPVASRGATVGANTCRRCHTEQHETWHASYHRTMTQSVTPADPDGTEPLAPFNGETLHVSGFVSTMDRDAAGQPRITVQREAPPGEVILEATVELTVGSHRYQQYVARWDRGGGDLERWRLPFAWHPEAGRWLHLGGAFLFPDDVPGDADAFLRHLSRWNDNCLFCHNTEPSPGLQDSGRFDTVLSELGISCEACHGPGDAHVRRQSDPFRRMLAGQGPVRGDPAVTHPGRLDADRHSEVCGRCHGQRIGHDVGDILAHGDGFLPGEALAETSRPIFADSTLASDPPEQRRFADRFWPDGTPRLSAYEYQGLLLSKCHADGQGLGCGDCHTMHGETPAMQLRPEARSDETCLGRCHAPAQLSGADVRGGHGGHADTSCAGCHMPRTTYGLLRGMISHRITAPDPAAALGREDMPDACTQCHVDRSRAWAASAMADLGFAAPGVAVARQPEQLGSRVERDLLGGDPVQRALAAHALGRADAVGPIDRRLRVLVDALEDDYPAVRWFAVQTATELARQHDPAQVAVLAGFDFMGDPAARLAVVAQLRGAWGPSRFERRPEVLHALQARREDAAIAIGE